MQSGVVCLMYDFSAWSQHPLTNLKFVAPPICIQELTRRCSLNRRPNPPSQAKVLLVVDRVLQVRQKQAQCVFLVMADHVTTTHVSIRHMKCTIHLIPRPEGSMYWCAYFCLAYTVRLTINWIRINKDQAMFSLQSDYLDGCVVVAHLLKMEPTDPEVF